MKVFSTLMLIVSFVSCNSKESSEATTSSKKTYAIESYDCQCAVATTDYRYPLALWQVDKKLTNSCKTECKGSFLSTGYKDYKKINSAVSKLKQSLQKLENFDSRNPYYELTVGGWDQGRTPSTSSLDSFLFKLSTSSSKQLAASDFSCPTGSSRATTYRIEGTGERRNNYVNCRFYKYQSSTIEYTWGVEYNRYFKLESVSTLSGSTFTVARHDIKDFYSTYNYYADPLGFADDKSLGNILDVRVKSDKLRLAVSDITYRAGEPRLSTSEITVKQASEPIITPRGTVVKKNTGLTPSKAPIDLGL